MSAAAGLKMEPLHRMASEGDTAGLRSMVKKMSKRELELFSWNAECNASHTRQGPLHMAAENGHFDTVYFLLQQHNVHVDQADRDLFTPLHCAASRLHFKCCTLLLTRFANPNATNGAQNTPMHYIVRGDYSEDLLELMDLCVARGANLEARNKFGETLLLAAAQRSRTSETIRWLLDHGADVHARDQFDVTALHKAVEVGNLLSVKILLKAGADPLAECSTLGTPLELAKQAMASGTVRASSISAGGTTVLELLQKAQELKEHLELDHDHCTYSALEKPPPAAAPAAAAGGGGAAGGAAAAAAAAEEEEEDWRSGSLYSRVEDLTFEEKRVVDPEALDTSSAAAGFAPGAAGAAVAPPPTHAAAPGTGVYGGGAGGFFGADGGVGFATAAASLPPPPPVPTAPIPERTIGIGAASRIPADLAGLQDPTAAAAAAPQYQQQQEQQQQAAVAAAASTASANDLWYFPDLTRMQTEELLAQQSQRCYLVRGSSVPGCYALSVGNEEEWNHMLVSPVEGGPGSGGLPQGFQLDQTRNAGVTVDTSVYPSIAELVKNSSETAGAVPIGKLIFPPEDVAAAEAAEAAAAAPAPAAAAAAVDGTGGGAGLGGLLADLAPDANALLPDTSALLAARARRMVAKLPSTSELENSCVADVAGFSVETATAGAASPEELWGRNAQKLHELLLFQPYNYQYFVHRSTHHVFLGTLSSATPGGRLEPIVVIIAPPTFADSGLRVIVYTRLGDAHGHFDPATLPDASAAEKVSKDSMWTKAKAIPSLVCPLVEGLVRDKFRNGSKEKISIIAERVARPTDALRQDLLDFEMKDPLRRKVFSVGLLHSKRGQTTEDECFNNSEMTPLLSEFMAFLGDKISLDGWTGYRGDLDTSSDVSTGAYSLYRRWKGFEIMFHSSTLLPEQEGTTEQLHRKRRIGNDIGVVVFQEGGTYVPPIRSKFLHCYYVVSPVVLHGETHYRLSVSTVEGVPEIPPAIPPGIEGEGLFKKGPAFRAFLLTKIINGQLAALNHPALREQIWCRPKDSFLNGLVSKYGVKASSRRLIKS